MTASPELPRVLVCARPAIGGVARVLDALLRGLPARGIDGTAALSGVEGTGLIDVAKATASSGKTTWLVCSLVYMKATPIPDQNNPRVIWLK